MTGWDHCMVLKLISEFKSHELLWNMKHSDFYNKVKKEEAWKAVTDAFEGVNVEEIKRKMDSLKGSFRRERSRNKMGSGQSAAGRLSNYKSHWFAYKAMSFLEDAEKPKRGPKSSSSSQNIKEESVDEEYHPVDNAELYLTENESQENIGEENHLTEDLSNMTVYAEPVNTAFNYPIKVEPAQSTEGEDCREPIKRRRVESEHCKDECSLFCEYLAAKLRTFDKTTRAILQHKFNNLIFEAEMATLNSQKEKDSSQSSHHTHYQTSFGQSQPLSVASMGSEHCPSPDKSDLVVFFDNPGKR